MTRLDKDQLARAYRMMRRIRLFETAALEAVEAGEIPGVIHTARGQEAADVGVMMRLGPADRIACGHRSHGQFLARGVPPAALMAELFGKKTGVTGGRGGSKHLTAPTEFGLLPTQSIVGAPVPLALGAALSAKLSKSGGMGVAFIGDGAINQGAVLESLNLAVVEQLPVLIVVIDNGYGQTTVADQVTAGRIGNRARAFGWHVVESNSRKLEQVAISAKLAIDEVRFFGPALLHIKVDRLDGFASVDDQAYRDPEAQAAAHRDDPLLHMEKRVPAALRAEIDAQEKSRIDEALADARRAPYPEVA